MLNIAVVGCGYWGPNLIRNFMGLPGCNMAKVCDTDEVRLAHIKSLYPTVETCMDFDELVDDPSIDAIVVALPVRFHYPMAKKSLEAGKHTFVEKPMASSTAECSELIEIARQKRLTLMVGHTFIYSPPVRKIKKIVDSGELGEIFYIATRRLNLGLFQQDINVAWDLAPHDLSIILHIMGKLPLSVNCQGKAHINAEIADVTNISLNFDNGGFATINSSWLNPNKVREMIFVGSKKMLVYDDLEPQEKIKIYDQRVVAPPHYDTFAEFHYSYHYGDVYCPYLKQYEPLKVETQHFLDCINTGQTSESCGEKGLEVVHILEKASASLNLDGANILLAD